MDERQPRLDGLRILVVEDTFIVAEEIVNMVASFGCEPIGPFAHVPQALEAMAHNHIAGALLDVNLGTETSYGVADELLWRQIPFIFMTGYASTYLEPGFQKSPTLSKPFTRAQLQQVMLSVFAKQPVGRV
jgi:CheY-like chemotaxis protein